MEEIWRQHGKEAALIDPVKMMIPGEDYLTQLMKNDSATALTAVINERVSGVMTCEVRMLAQLLSLRTGTVP